MRHSLHRFTEHVVQLSTRYIDTLGTGLPGMGGISGAMSGAGGSANDVVYSLKQQVAAFAHAYVDPATDGDDILRKAQEIEGTIMALQLTAGLSDSTVSTLIDELYDLVEERKR